jgi:hypothetical protein
MRIRLAIVSALLLVGAVTAATAAGTAGTSASAPKPKVVKVPLPAPNHSSVDRVKVTVTARNGRRVTASEARVAALKVSNPTHAQLPPGIRAVAAVTPRSSRKSTATFRVYVLINHITPSSHATAADLDVLPLNLKAVKFGTHDALQDAVTSARRTLFLGDCPELNKLGKGAEDSRDSQNSPALIALRSIKEQPSATEAVLDNVIYNLCPDSAERPDPGDK